MRSALARLGLKQGRKDKQRAFGMLYADDTLLLLKPNRNQILKVKLLFRIFGLISGLMVNLQKSELVTNCTQPTVTHNLANLINCKPAVFPINYLGLPLSDKKLTKNDYAPLIDKIRSKLSGWKASLLTIGGRAILTNAVLSAVPQYFMPVFLQPTWMTQKIDQLRRKFLWHGHKDQHNQIKGLYMVSWKVATKPRQQGGLGIRDIRITNYALLIKWMWQWHDCNSWWKQPTPMSTVSEKPWFNLQASPFWKSLKNLAPIFNCSVRFKIGDGKTALFWQDSWNGKPLKNVYPNLYQAILHKQQSVSQCRDETGWFLQSDPLNSVAQIEKEELLQSLQGTHTTQEPDVLEWIRSSSKFTVNSVYTFLALAPSPLSTLNNIWTIKAPYRVSIFTWLMISNRLTTVDNLVKRGWNLPNMFVLCQHQEETASHIFINCSLIKAMRNYVYSTFIDQQSIANRTAPVDPFSILTDRAVHMSLRKWEVVICFVIWRERCRRLFSDKFDTHIGLARQMRVEHDN